MISLITKIGFRIGQIEQNINKILTEKFQPKLLEVVN